MLTTKEGGAGLLVPSRGKDETMKIVMDRLTMIGGKPVERGEIADVPEQQARYLVNVGKATWPVDEKPAKDEAGDEKPAKETAASKRAAKAEKR